MLDKNKIKLHALITAISKLSADIDELKKKRDELLDEFKQIQLIEDNLDPQIK